MAAESPALIDVHAHYLTDRYVDAAKAAGVIHPHGMPGWPTWTVDEHLALMGETRTGRAMLSISSPGVHFGDTVRPPTWRATSTSSPPAWSGSTGSTSATRLSIHYGRH
jgi:hypothetical protein